MDAGNTSGDTAVLADGNSLPSPNRTEQATFGMGCFWGPEARFGAMEGVVRTRVGYAGGTKTEPSYYSLGDHTEMVQVEYDPRERTYEDLLGVFWDEHNWLSQAGKRQYRSVVLAGDDGQFETAQESAASVADRTGRTPATDIERLEEFWLAEHSHQKYELQSRPTIADELNSRGIALVDSTVAARLNGFVAGHGSDEQRQRLLAALDLPPAVLDELRRYL